MLVRRCLSLFLPALLLPAALAALAGPAAAPAAAGMMTGNVFDRFGNPLGGILVEALDAQTGAPFASGSTSAGQGDFSVEIESPPAVSTEVRPPTPRGVFTTTYLYDSPTLEAAELIGYS